MGWSLDRTTKIWKCTEYSDLNYREIINFAENGEPFSPYDHPGWVEDFEPDFANVVIEMPQLEVMTNGYGQKVTALDFPIVKRFLKEKLTFPYQQYTFDDLVLLGFAKPPLKKGDPASHSPDRTITSSLYGSPLAIAVPGKISAGDAAFIHGTVCFKLMKSTTFTYTAKKRQVQAEIGAGDDNWDFQSSTLPNWLEAVVAATLGPDDYNLDGPIRINFVGEGKKSWALSSPTAFQFMTSIASGSGQAPR